MRRAPTLRIAIYTPRDSDYNASIHGGELDSTLKAETVLQVVAPNHVKMGKAINANNNQPAFAYAA